MNIVKFDPETHNIDKAAELILSAYALSPGQEEHTTKTVIGLIEAGNNFFGHEYMYVAVEENNLKGLVICYQGKPGGNINSLIRMLIELRLKTLLNLIILNAELLHTGYTPDLGEDDFYISLVVVDKEERGKGLGKRLIGKAMEIAQQKGSSRLVLDVDTENHRARALYEKLGFKLRDLEPRVIKGALPAEVLTMEYDLTINTVASKELLKISQ